MATDSSSSSLLAGGAPQPVEQIYEARGGVGSIAVQLQQLQHHPGFHSPYRDRKCFLGVHQQYILRCRGISTETSSSSDSDDEQYNDRIIEDSFKTYWFNYAKFTSEDLYHTDRPIKELIARFATSVVPDPCPECGKSERFMHINIQYVWNEEAVIAWAEQESMEQREINMVPTQEAVIERLEKECLKEDDDWLIKSSDDSDRPPPCMICLEEFSVGSEVSKLPCSHVYHWSCIVPWLKTSHFCPTCRYCFPCLDSTTEDDEA